MHFISEFLNETSKNNTLKVDHFKSSSIILLQSLDIYFWMYQVITFQWPL